MSIRDLIKETANDLGMDPLHLATIISYETAGTFDPRKAGPTTQWGQHRGFIQFGEPQAQQYGVDWNDPLNSQLGAGKAVSRYFKDNGWQSGMGLLDAYSIVNAGAPGRYNASDANNGGAPGTVRDKVMNQMSDHEMKAQMLLNGLEVAGLTPEDQWTPFDGALRMSSRNGGNPMQTVDLTPPTIGEQLDSGALKVADTFLGKLFPKQGEIGFIKQALPHLSSTGVDQRLLGLGAGLLSGNDWASGLSAGFNNIQGVLANEQNLENKEAMMNADMAFRSSENALDREMRQSRTPEFQRVGNVMMPDGQIVGGVSYDPKTAEYFTIDEGGARKTLPGAVAINNSDATYSRFGTLAIKDRDAANEARGTLVAVDTVLSKLDETPTGIAGAVSDLQRAYNTLVGQGITPEQMARGLNQAELQGLIGKFKDEVVGGGVMTEQDAVRIIFSMGGDLQSVFTNPEILRERLTTLRGRAERRYQRHYDQYERYRANPFMGVALEPLDPYQPPSSNKKKEEGALSAPPSVQSQDIEDILRENGVD